MARAPKNLAEIDSDERHPTARAWWQHAPPALAIVTLAGAWASCRESFNSTGWDLRPSVALLTGMVAVSYPFSYYVLHALLGRWLGRRPASAARSTTFDSVRTAAFTCFAATFV
jgi:hypothetical protein